jgi:sulfatase modifying factor 1
VALVAFDSATARIGSDDDPAGREAPEHEVTLSPFGLSDHCVTAAEYCEFISSAPDRFDPRWCDYIDPCFVVCLGSGFELREGAGRFPMVQISHAGCLAYCNWLSEREGLEPVYDVERGTGVTSREGYRLPTEAEWEYACRSGREDRGPLPPDDGGGGAEFNYLDADPQLLPGRASRTQRGGFAFPDWSPVEVGTLPPDRNGVHELLGNVREWCHDFYRPYSAAPQRDPSGPERGVYRTVRGGSFLDPAEMVRPHVRAAVHGDNKCMQYGFRVARTLA